MHWSWVPRRARAPPRRRVRRGLTVSRRVAISGSAPRCLERSQCFFLLLTSHGKCPLLPWFLAAADASPGMHRDPGISLHLDGRYTARTKQPLREARRYEVRQPVAEQLHTPCVITLPAVSSFKFTPRQAEPAHASFLCCRNRGPTVNDCRLSSTPPILAKYPVRLLDARPKRRLFHPERGDWT